MELFIKELWRYPIDGCGGEKLSTANVGRRGINLDRRWIVVDEHGVQVTSRTMRRLSLLQIDVRTYLGQAVLQAPGMCDLVFIKARIRGEVSTVTVRGVRCDAVEVDQDASAWMSAYLSLERPGNYRLMQIVGNDSYREDTFVMILESSLNNLRNRLTNTKLAFTMDWFSPNLVLDGYGANAEDLLDTLVVNGITLSGHEFCAYDDVQESDLEMLKPNERALAVLAKSRRWRRNGLWKIWFGRNYSHEGIGGLEVGMNVEFKEKEK